MEEKGIRHSYSSMKLFWNRKITHSKQLLLSNAVIDLKNIQRGVPHFLIRHTSFV